MPDTNEISYIQIGSVQYGLSDLVARSTLEAINNGGYIVSTNAATTPKDVTWGSITGTLVASSVTIKRNIYLVPTSEEDDNDVFDEYIIVGVDTGGGTEYRWERLGNTEINFNNLGALAYKNAVTLNKGNGKNVLGSNATFTNSSSGVTVDGSQNANFVKSYPGVSSKMVTTTVTGVSGTTTASKATAGTAVTLAKRASAQTTVGNANVGTAVNAFTSATVTNGVLSFNTTGIAPAVASSTKIYGCGDTANITPYTFADVTVPVKDTNATTVATGALSGSGTGSSVLTGLGTATTGSAITSLGTLTAEAQTITVSKDEVKVAKYDDLSVSVSGNVTP